MITEKVRVKAKIGALVIEKEYDYDRPEDFEEAIEMDGEAKALKTYLNERKTNFQDKKRKGIIADTTAKLGALPAEKLRELGLDI